MQHPIYIQITRMSSTMENCDEIWKQEKEVKLKGVFIIEILYIINWNLCICVCLYKKALNLHRSSCSIKFCNALNHVVNTYFCCKNYEIIEFFFWSEKKLLWKKSSHFANKKFLLYYMNKRSKIHLLTFSYNV